MDGARQHQQQQQQLRTDADEDDDGRDEEMRLAVTKAAGSPMATEGPLQQETMAASKKNEGGGPDAADVPPLSTVVDRYVLLGKIDRGTFSTVSLASLRKEQHLPPGSRRLFAIKLITPTSHPVRIEREIRCMQIMGGQCNVVGIVDGFRHHGSVGLVMNYIPHDSFHEYFAQLTPAELQRYLQQLLIALERVHRHGVIHRDVKPSNFLYSRGSGACMLVDFGLAQETATGELSLDGSRKAETVEGDHLDPGNIKKHGDQVVPLHKQQQQDTIVVRNPLQGSNRPLPAAAPLKLSNSVTKDLADAPLARQVKSTAANIGSGLKHRRLMAPTGGNRSGPYGRERKTTDVGGGIGTNAAGPPCLPRCDCYGQPQVCNRCLVKREINAPRAGTPGYRPPEVLLKYPHQTTAVDIWAAGVIFLSMLAKLYPFFGNVDDLTSLANFISVFGFERLAETARALDRTLQVDSETMRFRALSLSRICQHFRELHRRRGSTEDGATGGAGGSSPPPGRDDEGYGCGNCCKPPDACLCQERVGINDGDGRTGCNDRDDEYGPQAYDLLERLLETNPHRRITATEALQHPYFQVQY